MHFLFYCTCHFSTLLSKIASIQTHSWLSIWRSVQSFDFECVSIFVAQSQVEEQKRKLFFCWDPIERHFQCSLFSFVLLINFRCNFFLCSHPFILLQLKNKKTKKPRKRERESYFILYGFRVFILLVWFYFATILKKKKKKTKEKRKKKEKKKVRYLQVFFSSVFVVVFVLSSSPLSFTLLF